MVSAMTLTICNTSAQLATLAVFASAVLSETMHGIYEHTLEFGTQSIAEPRRLTPAFANA